MSDCLFCELVSKKANVLFEDDKSVVMLSPEPSVPGHLLVLPKKHAPILEAVPDFVVGDLFKVANKASVLVFEGLGAQGVNVVVQNGPAAGQRHNHVMLNVVPRFENDNLPLIWDPKPSSDGDLAKAESSIKGEAKNVGVFEKEKPKPMEMEKPKEVKEDKEKDDYRIKQLRRTP